ncbi:kinase-like domain-containing protein [Lasiosphaeria miniovina]|uniref:Kinase-like domain-containing protein n=1 Tax=Lasiosphaeria miniovina TaxID=1954250 RepID=A0AA40B499_9PEZI|nr:kinase-like domain-containing protein [Lasiosphaeria miniovina]KAK0727435.1 kinase-like domain-containing protein [Lasiosphaeria miniovina]
MSSRPPPSVSSSFTPFSDAAAAIAAAQFLNKRNVQANSAVDLALAAAPLSAPGLTLTPSSTTTTASSTPQLPASQIRFHFQFDTIAPSPPPPPPPPPHSSSPEAASRPGPSQPHPQSPSGGTAALRVQTDLSQLTPTWADNSTSNNTLSTSSKSSKRPTLSLQHKTSASSLRPISRTPSVKTGSIATIFGSHSGASSTVGSPIISAMGDVTPLPSPLLSSDSPGPWKLRRRTSRDTPSLQPAPGDSSLSMSAEHSPTAPASTPSKKKGYYAGLSSGSRPSLGPSSGSGSGQIESAGGNDVGARTQPVHTRNRSISDYVPDPMLVPKRMVTVSGSHIKADMQTVPASYEGQMRREPHLSEARGLTPVDKPPTPPPSESSLSANDSSSATGSSSTVTNLSRHEYFEAYDRHDRKRRRWRSVKMLGQGTFSRVMLATSQISSLVSDDEEYRSKSGSQTPEPLPSHERRTLVAVKICEHGPRGGASEDRIEMSLKRELEIMQSIHHPSLIHLKAWNIEPSRAILMLSYCPGGDLFDLASGHKELLSPGILRRIYAELVGAVRYLHGMKIVHRDIKLENVLVNLPPTELQSAGADWTTYPYSLITLTDLGLARRVADNEKLETRCGSDDYAAPEVIMGQPYDGHATDAWSLGVLLYALLESRLPFDPHPAVGDLVMQVRMRSRTSHRIARVEWRWIEYGVRDGEEGHGDHEADLARFDAKGLRGAMEVVEGLLKRSRSRWSLAQIAETEWVRGAIQLEGGIKFREEEAASEV